MTIGNRPPTVRADGRGPNDVRPITFTLGVQKWAEGSCRIRVGDTEVLCAATIVDRVPPHLRGKGTGWVTAEYSMLPRATAERTDRESVKGRIGGRTHEMQRHLTAKVAAVSVGIVDGLSYLDLDYSEDSRADVDFNVVGTDAGAYVELQGTAEGKPFDRAAADGLLDLADSGLAQLFEAQAAVLATVRR